MQDFAKRHRYVLRLDIVKHFPSIDHAILLRMLRSRLADARVLELAARIIASGDGVLEQEYTMVWFPGDDLLAACRPRGLPIGNLTSQFWSNCYLHPLDLFIKRELGCRAYLRYVDDMALFADTKARALGLEAGHRRAAGRAAPDRACRLRAGGAGRRRHPLARLRRLSDSPAREGAQGRRCHAAAE